MKPTRTTPRNPDSTAYRNLHECVTVGFGVEIAGVISKSSLKGYVEINLFLVYIWNVPKLKNDRLSLSYIPGRLIFIE